MATPRVNKTAKIDVQPDLVGPDGERPELPADAPAPVESTPSVPPAETPDELTVEARKAALASLLAPESASGADEAPEEVEAETAPETGVEDLGGPVVCRVVFSVWTAVVGDTVRKFPKGSYVRVTADEADRGARLGGLRRVG